MNLIALAITMTIYSMGITSQNANLMDHSVNDFVYGFEDKDLIVPCKPIAPDVSVILTSSRNEEENKFSIASSNLSSHKLESHIFYYDSVAFDINAGFIFKGVHWIPPTLYCYPAAGQNMETEIITFKTSLTSFKAHEPIIRTKTQGNAHEGYNFELICEVYLAPELNENDFYLSWHTTDATDHVHHQKSLEFENTFTKHTNASFNVALSKLFIRNAQKSEGKTYYCHFSSDRHQVANYTMEILSPNETYLHLRELVQWIPKHYLRSKTIQVEHRGYPLPSLTWYDPHGNEIWSHNNRLSVQFVDHLTSLTLRYPRASDTGNYTLRATNGRETKELLFNIRVKGFLMRTRYNSETGTMEKVNSHI